MTSANVAADRVALVLAGAVAKGAFGVGAISYVANTGCQIHRIVGTSSGALTAAVLGAGIATGQLAFAADVAKELWLTHGAWSDIAHVSVADWFHAKGLLDTSKLIGIVKDGMQRVVEHAAGVSPPVAAKVTIITTSLNAMPGGEKPLPSYENPVHFDGVDFLDRGKWDAIATAAAASATFPGVFAPTMLDGEPCIDGGAVNNAPISYVLDDAEVRKVIIITSESSEPPPVVAQIGGIDLVGRVADIMINERVSSDLFVAQKTNALLNAVKTALEKTGATVETKAEVIRALGWRELDLVLIHPGRALPGTSFSGFFDAALRQTYVEEGELAAKSALGVT